MVRARVLSVLAVLVTLSACASTASTGGGTAASGRPAAPPSPETLEFAEPEIGEDELAIIEAREEAADRVAVASEVDRFDSVGCDLFYDPPGRESCWQLLVPADRDEPDGRLYSLEVVKLHALNSSERVEDPLLYLNGGPGGGAIDELESLYEDYFAEIRETRDIIVLDQRGTGYSSPYIACFAPLGFDTNLRRVEDVAGLPRTTIDALADCRDDARTSADLRTIGSAATVDDIEDLRVAMEISQWNILGISHGTRVALRTMALRPQTVRSVILDSVDPPDINAYALLPQTIRGSLDELFAECEDDRDCRREYPDIAQRFDDLLEALDDDPLRLDIPGAERLDAAGLLSLVQQLSYQVETLARIPQLVAELEDGDTSTVEMMATAPGGFGFSQAVQLIHLCAEDVPYTSASEIAAGRSDVEAFNRIDYYRYVVTWAEDACEILGIDVDPVAGRAVSSDVPTLILSGTLDGITPPSNAYAVAEHLSDSTVVEAPRSTHAVAYGNDCVAPLLSQFVDDLEVAVPDCLDDIDPLPFVVEAPTDVVLAPVEIDVNFTPLNRLTVDAPVDWELDESFFGTSWLRGLTAFDTASVLIYVEEPLEGFSTVEDELSYLVGETQNDVRGTLVLGGRSWETIQSVDQGQAIVLHQYREAGLVLTIVLTGPEDELDGLREMLEQMTASVEFERRS